jgi:hypothetical protein
MQSFPTGKASLTTSVRPGESVSTSHARSHPRHDALGQDPFSKLSPLRTAGPSASRRRSSLGFDHDDAGDGESAADRQRRKPASRLRTPTAAASLRDEPLSTGRSPDRRPRTTWRTNYQYNTDKKTCQLQSLEFDPEDSD